MQRAQLLQRIQRRSDVLSGRPTVRGLRVSVDRILGLLASGMTHREVFEEFPELEPEDLIACELFAVDLLLKVRQAMDERNLAAINEIYGDLPTESLEALTSYTHHLLQRVSEATKSRTG